MVVFHIGFSIVIAGGAIESLVLISLFELPSLHIMGPRYLKVFRSSSACPFIFKLLGPYSMRLFTRIVLLPMLISYPCDLENVSNLVVRS